MSFWRYIVSSDFGNAVMENWQSEYLQFMLFMLATIWLVQRGSPESKPLGQAGRETRPESRRSAVTPTRGLARVGEAGGASRRSSTRTRC